MMSTQTDPLATIYCRERSQSFRSEYLYLALKISPMEINQIKDIIKSGVVGTFPISTKFTHATGDYNVITGSYLGNITLKTEGTLITYANDS